MGQMKTLTNKGKTYEIVDATARALCYIGEEGESEAVVSGTFVEGTDLNALSNIDYTANGVSAVSLLRSGRNIAATNVEGWALPASSSETLLLDVGKGVDMTCDELTISIVAEGTVYTNGSAALIGIQRSDESYTYLVGGRFMADDGSFFYVGEARTGTYSYTVKDISFRRIYAYIGGEYGNFTSGVASIQIEYGGTVHDFEPASGQVFTASLGQTVHGGSFNWSTGVLTVTHDADGLTDSTQSVQLAAQPVTARNGVTYLKSSSGDTAVGDTREAVKDVVLDLVGKVNTGSFTNILCVGDSWSEGWNGVLAASYDEALTWPNLLADNLGCEFTAVREGGAGFTTTGWNGNTFITLAETAATGDYDAGVIVGGINDWEAIANQEYGTIAAAMLELCNIMYAKSNGKMRDIYWCMFWGPKGWGTQIPRTIGNIQIYMDAKDLPYRLHCFPCWDAIMTRTNNWVVDGTNFDALHPSAEGYRAVANTVARYMLGMQAAYQNTDTQWAVPFTLNSDLVAGGMSITNVTRDGSAWDIELYTIPACSRGTTLLTSRMHKFLDSYGFVMWGEGDCVGLYGNNSQLDMFATTTTEGYGRIRIEGYVSDPSGTFTI